MCGGSSEVGLLSRLSRNACTRKIRTSAPAASPSSRGSRFAEGIAAHFSIRSPAGSCSQGLSLQDQGRAARHGQAHHGDQPSQAAAPVREQVDILQLPLDRTRDGTMVEANRYDENLIHRAVAGGFQAVMEPLGLLRILFYIGDEYLGKPPWLKAEAIDSVR